MITVENSSDVNLSGTVKNIPLKKVIFLGALIGFIAIILLLGIDMENWLTLRNFILLSLSVGVSTFTYLFFEKFYEADHINQIAKFRWIFYVKIKRYSVDQDIFNKI